MEDFDAIIERGLDQLNSAPDRVNKIRSALQEIQLVEKRLAELKEQLRHAQEELNTALAQQLRNKVPGLNVMLSNGGCMVNYKSRALRCRPDHTSMRWQFEPDENGRRFLRNHGVNTGLTNDVSVLANSIAQFFSDRYKTLGARNG
jgi:hypothetical protein